MSKFLEIGAAGGALAVLVVAYNFADRNIHEVPPLPDRSEAIAAYTAPPPSPMMAAVAQNGEAGGYGLGRPALPEEIAAWDLDVMPDGTGLPEGSGDVWTGEEVFVERCAACHGDFAEGVGNWPKLAGGEGTLDEKDPVKTVGSYWPYLSTAWDYVHRSMPFGDAQSLTDDEVYAIVAYILYSNFLVEDDFTLSNENFLEVEMPNADGFIVDDREEAEAHFWQAEPCMEDCKDDPVEVTMRATVLDVTPEEEDGAAMEEDHGAVAAVADTPAEAVEAAEDVAGDDAAVVEVAAADPEMIAEGEKVFRQCKSCHEVGEGAKNRTGPHLNDLMGRPAGGVDGFRYSGAFDELAEAGVVWTPETLAAFLEDPRAYAKGTRMSFRGLSDAEDVEAVTAYLASFDQ